MMCKTRFFHLCMLCILVPAVPLCGDARTEDGDDEDVRVSNPFFVAAGDSVIITYDLVAPPDATVDVSIVLRKESDPTFAVIPVSVSGAIGKVRGGGPKTVLWDYRRDVTDGFHYASDYWFEITAVKEDEGFGLEWWHYALGGAGVVTAAILIAGGSDASSDPTGLPNPPGTRPER
jgi:hypothetical protein